MLEKTKAAIVEGADPSVVGPYLAEHLGDESWNTVSVELISGGKSNLTYLVTSGAGEVILRRPPLGHVLPTAHDMTREFTVLSGLSDTDVPTPRPIHLCTDPDVLGVTFYVMERMKGHIVRNEFPPGYADTPEQKRLIGEGLVDTLVRLHRVDWKAVGLGEFGHPEGFMARQIRRWKQQWEKSVTRPLEIMDQLISQLEQNLPVSPSPTIVHGDFRLDNAILDATDPGKVVAVLDWEMSTIGDPLADLGLMLCYWPQQDDNDEFKRSFSGITATAAPGFPSRDSVLEQYARRSGRDVSQVYYYWAFGFFKLAVILEGIHARFLQGKTLGEGFEGIGERVPPLVMLGLWVLDRKEVSAI
ncbi:MAG TPA: phosphotransferase family protein [Actinomycetota bacterium]|nr:phosphotransferase family protein [Actinomycetota bacterium]